MYALLPYLTLLGFLAAVLGFFTWPARRIRRRGTAGGGMSGALAAYEEAFRATSHASHHEIRARGERKVPTDSPDGLRRRRRGKG
ncbi:hypothetical protein OG588_09200 [Streptomyces prunicolor]|uniref:hypothetical protein n=1 Tax=Streptomyces prunicolor TaxID=67348 RepID=UPI003867D2B8|nr:hypothetical protein OG588_09200 [Streptomyces prunicolor]